MRNELKLDLLENSIDSLINGLNNYKIAVDGDDKYLKYAVLSLSIYIELSLKYFVWRINPLLIFSNAFSEKPLTNKTITMNEAANFLENLYKNNFDIDKSRVPIKEIKELHKISNDIKHHSVNIDNVRDTKVTIGKILSILDILYRERGISIYEKLGDSEHEITTLYETVIDEYTHENLLIKAAEETAQKNAEAFSPSWPDEPSRIDIDEATHECPSCEQYTLSLTESCDEYYCTNCFEEISTVTCEYCNNTFPESEKYKEINDYYWCCKACLDGSKKLKGCD